jgi:hypothetical protein
MVVQADLGIKQDPISEIGITEMAEQYCQKKKKKSVE